jgi:hypothetical protein
MHLHGMDRRSLSLSRTLSCSLFLNLASNRSYSIQRRMLDALSDVLLRQPFSPFGQAAVAKPLVAAAPTPTPKSAQKASKKAKEVCLRLCFYMLETWREVKRTILSSSCAAPYPLTAHSTPKATKKIRRKTPSACAMRAGTRRPCWPCAF